MVVTFIAKQVGEGRGQMSRLGIIFGFKQNKDCSC